MAAAAGGVSWRMVCGRSVMRKLGGQEGRNPVAGEESLHFAQAGWIEAPFGLRLHRSRRVLVTVIMALP